jgi:hypothetical protein
MRDATLSRRDVFRAAGAPTVGAAFAEALKSPPPNPAGLAPSRHLELRGHWNYGDTALISQTLFNSVFRRVPGAYV